MAWEGCGGVGHSEEHDCGFIEPFVGDECGLPFITPFNTNIVVPPADVEFCEEFLHPDAVD